MGYRAHLGIGYGVQLTRGERTKTRIGNIVDTYVEYFRKLYTMMEKNLDPMTIKDDKEEIDRFGLALEIAVAIRSGKRFKDNVNDIEDQKEREQVIRCRLEDLVYEWILYPNKEVGSKTFFGYVAECRHPNVLDYALIYNILKPDLKVGEKYEFMLPATNMKEKVETIKGKDDEDIIIPNRRFLNFDNQFTKAMLERHDKTGLVDFETESECENFVDKFYKVHSEEGYFFDKALAFVQQLFPEKTMNDLNRFLLIWWV